MDDRDKHYLCSGGAIFTPERRVSDGMEGDDGRIPADGSMDDCGKHCLCGDDGVSFTRRR